MVDTTTQMYDSYILHSKDEGFPELAWWQYCDYPQKISEYEKLRRILGFEPKYELEKYDCLKGNYLE